MLVEEAGASRRALAIRRSQIALPAVTGQEP
jgi:hypothetical protein